MTAPAAATAAVAAAAVGGIIVSGHVASGRVVEGRAGGAEGRAAGTSLHSRICAVVTAASCLAHVWLAGGNHHGLWLNALMLAMVAVCVPCAVHVWRHSSVAALRRIMASGVAMAVLHGFLLLAPGGSAHSHAGSAPAVTAAATGSEWSAAAALLAVIALEITTAFLASTLVARLRSRAWRELAGKHRDLRA